MNNIKKENIIKNFNPNENGLNDHGVFGLPFGEEESKLVLVPIPWEATVSYGGGTSDAPKAILDSSQQIDLYDPLFPDGWKEGIVMQDIPTSILFKSKHTREKVLKYLDKYTEDNIDSDLQLEINNDCKDLNVYVKDITSKLLDEDKIVGIVGGDHSVPLGYLESLSTKYKDFGILHIDAHADLRDAYEGMIYSHASIFFNALKIKNISKLVQVGVRDYCEQENNTIIQNKGKIYSFTDYEIKKAVFEGQTLKDKYKEIIDKLPQDVYISFDVDGLVPYLSPNTGTPVMGGFTVDEIIFLIEEVIATGRKIIGFDLCEVSKGEGDWDGNVGARILYKLCLLTLKSHNNSII